MTPPKSLLPFRLMGLFCLEGLCFSAAAAPVLNEIMFRPGTGYPENTALEFVEIHNPDAADVDLSGWALTKGVNYVFPSGTTLAAGGYLVVASNPAALQSAAGITGVAGPWEAGNTLSNNGETVTLSQPDGEGGWTEADSVDYADEGDFAVRTRDSLGGWSWVSGAGGGGKSLERRNPRLAGNNGQNWGDSAAAGGTPGKANSLLTDNIAPVIAKVRHSPAVPASGDPVTVSCQLTDEAGSAELTAALFWRNATTATPGAFQSVAMTGGGGGYFSATLPAMADKQIVEYYLSASDGALTRTWPAPTSEGQNANAAWQVDNEVITGGTPAYRLILTAAENAAFTAVASSSNRQFNATLVVTRGGDTVIRHRCSMRIRGFSSRNYTFRPLRFSIPADDRWNGVREFNLNPKYPWVQHLAMKFCQAADLPAGDTTPVELRRNGVEYTVGGSSAQDYGQWVRVEPLSSDYADRHWPAAEDVQVYRKESSTYWSSAGGAPSNPDGSYSGWTKKNHQAANDWSDVMGFSALWQSTAASHFTGITTQGSVQTGTWSGTPFTDAEMTTLSQVADFDHMARWFAVMTILNNGEPNIANGGREDDDYAGAFVSDGVHRRLQLLPYDLDASLGQGEESRTATAGGLYPMTTPSTGGGGGGMGGSSTGFEPLLPLFGNATTAGNAAFRARYLGYIRQYYGTIFDADTSANSYPPAHAFVDNHLGEWVPASVRTAMKTYMTQRQAYLLGLIGAGKITPAASGQGTLTTAVPEGVRLNEILASNVSAASNGSSFPDIIELHNSGSADVDLGGYTLSDDPAEPAKYTFPAGTILTAGGFLVVYADSDTAAPGLHTGFGLSADGDSVLLHRGVAAGGGLVDAITFGPQLPDLSIARNAVTPGVWELEQPSAGMVNGTAAELGNLGGVRLNEWSGQRDFRIREDFVELYNPSALPVALGGARITDNGTAYPDRYAFPALSFIPAKGFLVRTKGDLGFGLNGMFDSVFLLSADGQWIDQADFTSQFTDWSNGRSPDGGTAWAAFEYPTPGMGNATSPPAASLALLERLRITEIMFQPEGGSAYEFVELQNIGAVTLDLSGVRFTDGISYTFAAGATLAPGAFTVVARDRASFLSRWPGAAGVLAEGNFSGSLDNSGETLTLTLPEPWRLNILSFRYEPSWYPLAAGGGYSLVTADQSLTAAADWDQAMAWSASPQAGGTPGSDGAPSITTLPDTDGDGLPDEWEVTHGFDPASAADAAQDTDGDGQSNLAEYLAGTDPQAADSVFAIIAAGWTAEGAFEITFSAVEGRTYQLSVSANLQEWSAQGSPWTPARSGAHTFEISADSATRLYFRVCLAP